MKIAIAGETERLAGQFQVISAWSGPAGVCSAEFHLVSWAKPDSGEEACGVPNLAAEFTLPSGPGLVSLIAAALWLGQRACTRR
jgi:hypothetical protein